MLLSVFTSSPLPLHTTRRRARPTPTRPPPAPARHSQSCYAPAKQFLLSAPPARAPPSPHTHTSDFDIIHVIWIWGGEAREAHERTMNT
eukprot:scaffold12995_cov92-Isochrysis_galbana.AAC.2